MSLVSPISVPEENGDRKEEYLIIRQEDSGQTFFCTIFLDGHYSVVIAMWTDRRHATNLDI